MYKSFVPIVYYRFIIELLLAIVHWDGQSPGSHVALCLTPIPNSTLFCMLEMQIFKSSNTFTVINVVFKT